MNISYVVTVFHPSRWLCGLMLALSIMTLNGCATAQHLGKVEHGFDVTNKGPSVISKITVRYGSVTRTFCQRGCATGGGSFYGVYMPIQEEMFVSWQTADGEKHEVLVPVKQRVNDVHRFRRLFLQFNGGALVVKQGAYFSNPGLVGWDESPLYP